MALNFTSNGIAQETVSASPPLPAGGMDCGGDCCRLRSVRPSREKVEDEFTLHLRVSSALTSLLVVFVLWILKSIANVFLVRLLPMEVFGEVFGPVQIVLNFLTGFVAIFVIYLTMFKIRLARFNQKEGTHEE